MLAVTFQGQGQQKRLAAEEGNIPSDSQSECGLLFLLLLLSWQTLSLGDRMLSSETSSTVHADARKVAAQQVSTFLGDCLGLNEFISHPCKLDPLRRI